MPSLSGFTNIFMKMDVDCEMLFLPVWRLNMYVASLTPAALGDGVRMA